MRADDDAKLAKIASLIRQRRAAEPNLRSDASSPSLIRQRRAAEPNLRFDASSPQQSRTSPRAAVALCVCGAAGEGTKQLTGLQKDMDTAMAAFSRNGVTLQDPCWMEKVDKAHLMKRVRQLAHCEGELCFIYYTGHGKRRGEFAESAAVAIDTRDCGGAWVLSRASEAERLEQTLDDLLPLQDLLDEWERGLRARPDFNRRRPRPRLMILPDCCASGEFARQLGPKGAEEARRERLGISLHIVSITTDRNVSDIIDIGYKIMALG